MKKFAGYMPADLIDELNALDYKVDGTGILMAFGQGNMPKKLGPNLLHCLSGIAGKRNKSVVAVMVNRIPRGVDSKIHVDPGPRRERWHLPVQTNPRAWFWTEEHGNFHMHQGFWYGPVEYWKPHRVWNDGESIRVHLVVDLE